MEIMDEEIMKLYVVKKNLVFVSVLDIMLWERINVRCLL